jgi:hypothetical protein
VDSYTQTWDGSAWTPVDSATTYDEAGTETACHYKCALHYTWSGESCVPDTRTFECPSKPVGAIWNTVPSYTQTWHGSAWSPADSPTTYDETQSESSCHFICARNYTWDGLSCAADTRTFACNPKPTGTQWNTVPGYTQTWDGLEWTPADSETIYDEIGSATSCSYVCAQGYHWDGGACVSSTRMVPCPGSKPLHSSWTSSELVQFWNPAEEEWEPLTCQWSCDSGTTLSDDGSACVVPQGTTDDDSTDSESQSQELDTQDSASQTEELETRDSDSQTVEEETQDSETQTGGPSVPVPGITVQPSSQEVDEGALIELEIQAQGEDLIYQWLRDGSPVPGAMARILKKAATFSEHGATYRCRVSNSAGAVVSEPASIAVRDKTPPVLTLGLAEQVSTEAGSIHVFGHAFDAGVGLESVSAAVDTAPDLAFAAVVSASGAFSAHVPLVVGNNTVIVSAVDRAGNQSQVVAVVTATLPALPELVVTEPVPGAVLYKETVDVRGVVRSSLPAGQIRLSVDGGESVFPSGENGVYSFELPRVPLVVGSNILIVQAETPRGTTAIQVAVRREAGPSGGLLAPVIELNVKKNDVFTSSDTFTVSGLVRSSSPLSSISVNGAFLGFQQIGEVASFRKELSFSSAGASLVPIVVEAVATSGGRAAATYTMHKDGQAPILEVERLQEMPAVNSLLATPYRLEGSVTDPNLAGLVVNQQSIGALPGGAPDEWTFEVSIPLSRGAPVSVNVQAWDLAGNVTSRLYQLSYDASVELEIIEPQAGTVLYSHGATEKISVKAAAPGLSDTDVAVARLDGGSEQVLMRTGDILNGSFDVTVDGASHNIAVEVRAQDGVILASALASVRVVDAESVPLSVSRFEPRTGDAGIEPVTSVALYFNRPVDPSRLTIDVRQTVHGQRYEIPEAADITRQTDVKLVDVDKEREPVTGGVSVLPGQTMAAFYAQGGYEYGATVLVIAIYDGQEVGRSSFEVRPLPTLVQGFLIDEELGPVVGVEVSVPALGLVARTDVEGGYQFGFGESVENTIPPGSYRMTINPGQRAPRFMTVERWLTVEEARLNNAGAVMLPRMSAQEPFRVVASGDPKVLLSRGMLELNLQGATLRFEDGGPSGEISARAVVPSTVPFPYVPGARPTISFLLSPAGVEVDGEVGVTFHLPTVDGTFEYLESMPDWLVLIGLDRTILEIVPVGVMKLDRTRGALESRGKVHLGRLDYLGVAAALPERFGELSRYAAGEMDIQELSGSLAQTPQVGER